MKIPFPLLMVLAFFGTCSAADWPGWRGPAGGGSQPQPELDGKLIDRAEDIRLAWKSEAYVEDTFTGAYSSPVVVDGKVYLYFYQGDGKALMEGYFPEQGHRKQNYKDIPKEEYAKRPSPAADEIVLCMDARTGKTIWRFVSPSTGLNHQRENTAAHCSPYVGEGKVVVLGNTGILFCLDAATGTEVWRHEHENYLPKRQHRDEMVAERRITGGGGPGSFPFSAPLNVDGQVIIGTQSVKFDGKRYGSHWEAYDLASGKRVWQVPGRTGAASAQLWTHQGKPYIIGNFQCIDPRSGKELWKLSGVNCGGTPALAGDILVFSHGSAGGANAVRLSLQGATPLWHREKNETVSSCNTSPGTHRGVAYLHCSNALGKNKGYVLAIDLETGKELARHDDIISVKCTPSMVAIADRVIFPRLGGGIHLFGVGTDFVSRGVFRHKLGFAKGVTPAVADGFLYSHGKDGLYCFDLRK